MKAALARDFGTDTNTAGVVTREDYISIAKQQK
jgi:hypothetical protein